MVNFALYHAALNLQNLNTNQNQIMYVLIVTYQYIGERGEQTAADTRYSFVVENTRIYLRELVELLKLCPHTTVVLMCEDID